MILAGASQIVPDSGDVVGTPGPMPGPDAVYPSPGCRHCDAVLRHRRPGAVLRVIEIEAELVFLRGLPRQRGPRRSSSTSKFRTFTFGSFAYVQMFGVPAFALPYRFGES